MEKSYLKDYKYVDEIEKLRLNLYKYSDLIIQNSITEEILLKSEELDISIIKYYKKDTSDTEMT